jgi:hypothetical protein
VYSNARDDDKSKETFRELCGIFLVFSTLSFHWIHSLFAEERTNGANETNNVCYCYSDGQIDVH